MLLSGTLFLLASSILLLIVMNPISITNIVIIRMAIVGHPLLHLIGNRCTCLILNASVSYLINESIPFKRSYLPFSPLS
jgi:hypothetical protein